jgi:hypothetical protein
MHLTNEAVAAYWEELEKIAVSVEQLQQAVRRLGVVRVPRVHPKEMKELIQGTREAASRGNLPIQATVGGGVATLPFVKNIDPILASRKGMFMSAGGLSEEAATELLRDIARKARPLSKRFGGTILATKGDTSVGAFGPGMSPQAKKAANFMLRIHEGSERKAMKRGGIVPGFGHSSPEVMFDESNMLQRLTGPGADEAKKKLTDYRMGRGEYAKLLHIINKVYGPKGAQAINQHGFSKAMKKDLMRRFRSGEVTW